MADIRIGETFYHLQFKSAAPTKWVVIGHKVRYANEKPIKHVQIRKFEGRQEQWVAERFLKNSNKKGPWFPDIIEVHRQRLIDFRRQIFHHEEMVRQIYIEFNSVTKEIEVEELKLAASKVTVPINKV